MKPIPELSYFETIEYKPDKVSLHVAAAELKRFMDQNQDLAWMVADEKADLEEREGLSATGASSWIAEHCQISEDTLKKSILGKIKITRTFLYKFTVGFNMSLEKANQFFELCGGPLYERCLADYICIRALEDKDNIQTFITDFEKHTEISIHMRNRSK